MIVIFNQLCPSQNFLLVVVYSKKIYKITLVPYNSAIQQNHSYLFDHFYTKIILVFYYKKSINVGEH